MDPQGAQMEPKNQQIEPQGATKNKEHAKLSTKGGKVEPQVLQWSPKEEKHIKCIGSANEALKWSAKF